METENRPSPSPQNQRNRATCPNCGISLGEKSRSYEQHKRFFSVVEAAYRHWPDDPAKPDTLDHFRKWLLIQSGWFHRYSVRIAAWSPKDIERAILTVQGMMRALYNDHVEISADFGTRSITAYVAKSQKFTRMSHDQACRVFAGVDDVICAKLGIQNTDVLLQEYGKET